MTVTLLVVACVVPVSITTGGAGGIYVVAEDTVVGLGWLVVGLWWVTVGLGWVVECVDVGLGWVVVPGVTDVVSAATVTAVAADDVVVADVATADVDAGRVMSVSDVATEVLETVL